jgi:hypothetical protein
VESFNSHLEHLVSLLVGLVCVCYSWVLGTLDD